MFYSASLSNAAQASLWVGAIAGGLLSVSFHPASAATTDIQPLVAQTSAPVEVNREAVLAIALGGSAAIGLGLSATINRQRQSQPEPRFENVNFDRVSRPLQQKLIRALHGDRPAATRLFAQVHLKHPGKTSDWYAEKVIYDLERDRRK